VVSGSGRTITNAANMTFLPIVERELRSAARQEFTYHLRMIGAAGLLVATTVFLVRHGDERNLGGKLFANLHLTLFCATWLVVPFLTADCISQERREGTLGLLFLTRLKSRDLVIAKGLAHGLRALTLWLVVLPIMAIPFVLGGVGWTEALTSVLVNSSALCLALAAGLVASSLSGVWTRVAVWAGILSAAFCLLFLLIYLLILSASTFSLGRFLGQMIDAQLVSSLMEGFRMATDWDRCWAEVLSRFGTSARAGCLGGSALTAAVSLLGLLLAIRFVAGRVRRIWQEEPPSQRLIWLENTFCRPVVFSRFFNRWMKHKLESNPVGWLELRSWSGRLIAWGWLGLVAFLYGAVLSESALLRGGGAMHQVMTWLLGASMALSAAGSFRRERESGVLELLLVSPLGEDEIIMGRLRGLWVQFLPAGCLILAVWYSLTSLVGFPNREIGALDLKAVVYYGTGFLGLPVIGLYFSLACRGFLSALLATLAVGLLAAPVFASWIVWVWGFSSGVGFFSSDGELVRGTLVLCQLFLTALCWFGLSQRLKRRTFPLQRTAA